MGRGSTWDYIFILRQMANLCSIDTDFLIAKYGWIFSIVFLNKRPKISGLCSVIEILDAPSIPTAVVMVLQYINFIKLFFKNY